MLVLLEEDEQTSRTTNKGRLEFLTSLFLLLRRLLLLLVVVGGWLVG